MCVISLYIDHHDYSICPEVCRYNCIQLFQPHRPLPHKLLTINNYENCPSNFVFARSICLFHPPIFEKSLCGKGPLGLISVVYTVAPYSADQQFQLFAKTHTQTSSVSKRPCGHRLIRLSTKTFVCASIIQR